MRVWLIEKRWTDPYENDFSNAMGWKTVGYVTDEDPNHVQTVLRYYETATREYEDWPIKGSHKLYHVTKLEQLVEIPKDE